MKCEHKLQMLMCMIEMRIVFQGNGLKRVVGKVGESWWGGRRNGKNGKNGKNGRNFFPDSNKRLQMTRKASEAHLNINNINDRRNERQKERKEKREE